MLPIDGTSILQIIIGFNPSLVLPPLSLALADDLCLPSSEPSPRSEESDGGFRFGSVPHRPIVTQLLLMGDVSR
jgi:hypothetical protein